MVSVQDLGKCSARSGALYIILYLPKVQSVVIKQHTQYFKLINGLRVLMIEYFVFSVLAGLILEMLFVLFSVYNAV